MLIPACILGFLAFVLNYQLPFLNLKVFAVVDSFPFSKSSKFSFISNNITDELLGLFIIIGSLFVACSKEKTEDEFIAQSRLESLLWATYFNYSLLLLAIIFVYGMDFFSVLIFNMFTHLLIFLMRFKYVLYKNNQAIHNEK